MYALHKYAWSKWLQMCTSASASMCDPVSSSCPVSFESALRGLTWAATCLSLIRPNEAPPTNPLTAAHLFFSLFLSPTPLHICTVLLWGHWNTRISVPLANLMHEKDVLFRASLMMADIIHVFWLWWHRLTKEPPGETHVIAYSFYVSLVGIHFRRWSTEVSFWSPMVAKPCDHFHCDFTVDEWHVGNSIIEFPLIHRGLIDIQ